MEEGRTREESGGRDIPWIFFINMESFTLLQQHRKNFKRSFLPILWLVAGAGQKMATPDRPFCCSSLPEDTLEQVQDLEPEIMKRARIFDIKETPLCSCSYEIDEGEASCRRWRSDWWTSRKRWTSWAAGRGGADAPRRGGRADGGQTILKREKGK